MTEDINKKTRLLNVRGLQRQEDKKELMGKLERNVTEYMDMNMPSELRGRIRRES